jgi:hypothetical protein
VVSEACLLKSAITIQKNMNWPQIGSQVVSTLIAGIIAAGPVGLVAKFYIDRKLKKLDARDAERLESVKDDLGQKRDSRQARIAQSNYATQKCLELEFEAIADLFAGIATLNLAMDNCRSSMQRNPPGETDEQRRDRWIKPARELAEARNAFLTSLANAELFCTGSVHKAATECLRPVWNEMLQIFTSQDPDPFSPIGYLQSEKNKEQFYPLARRAKEQLRSRMDELKRLPD